MFIVSYYLFIIIYAGLLMYVLPTDFIEVSNPFWYLFAILSLVIGVVLSFFTQLFILKILGHLRSKKGPTDKLNHKIGNSLLRLGLHILRVKVIVTGKENIPKEHFIVVGNHQENYDIIILKPIFKDHALSFIAKASLVKLPVIGKWIVLLGNVFISPYADRSAAESIINAIKNYKLGMSMGIFPEGKRSFSNEMIEFKPGAFKLAMKPKADILIVTQYNTCTIFKKFPWRRYRVYVHIHELLPYDTYKDFNSHELSDFVKAKIQVQLDTFQKQLG